MKILAFVDLHGSAKSLKRIVEKAKNCDVVVCAGDLTVFGADIDFIVGELNKTGKPSLFVHGNHEDDASFRKSCSLFKNAKFIHNSSYRYGDYLFIGWGGEGFSRTSAGLEKESKRLTALIKKGDKVIFVSHAPPYATNLDYIYEEHHGNKTIKEFVKDIQPNLVICGHFHELAGKEDFIGKIKMVNPGKDGKIIEI